MCSNAPVDKRRYLADVWHSPRAHRRRPRRRRLHARPTPSDDRPSAAQRALARRSGRRRGGGDPARRSAGLRRASGPGGRGGRRNPRGESPRREAAAQIAFVGFICGTTAIRRTSRSQEARCARPAWILGAEQRASGAHGGRDCRARHCGRRQKTESRDEASCSAAAARGQRRLASFAETVRRAGARRDAGRVGAAGRRRSAVADSLARLARHPAVETGQQEGVRRPIWRRAADAGGVGVARECFPACKGSTHPARGAADRVGAHVRPDAGGHHRRDACTKAGRRTLQARGRWRARRRNRARAVPPPRRGGADVRHHQPVDAGVDRATMRSGGTLRSPT